MNVTPVPLDLLQQALGAPLDTITCEPITVGKSGGRVLRLRRPGAPPLILKILEADKVAAHLRINYPHIDTAELHFYRELVPGLDLPAARLEAGGALPEGGSWLLLEDLAVAHRIPAEDHVWTDADLRAILTTYARMHGRSLRLFASEPVPAWLHTDLRQEYTPAVVLDCFRRLAANSWTSDLAAPVAHAPNLAQAAEAVAHSLNHVPTALLYNDFYPCNVAIPLDGGPAKLFDWQIAGTGPLHSDIINVGLLKADKAFAQVDQAALLAFYLDLLGAETGERPDTATFIRHCREAELMDWGVFLPNIVRAMERCNEAGRQFSEWMQGAFRDCVRVWSERV